MKENNIEHLKYPIGHFEMPEKLSQSLLDKWISTLENLPIVLEDMVKDLTEEQLKTPYRIGGWSVQQLVHHIADSHHHSYTRFKWALTEDNPLIKAYEEKDWSDLFDAKTAPIELSLIYLKALHAKLVFLLKGLSADDQKKSYRHPENNSVVTVAENIGKYAWHSEHHCAHIRNLIAREDW